MCPASPGETNAPENTQLFAPPLSLLRTPLPSWKTGAPSACVRVGTASRPHGPLRPMPLSGSSGSQHQRSTYDVAADAGVLRGGASELFEDTLGYSLCRALRKRRIKKYAFHFPLPALRNGRFQQFSPCFSLENTKKWAKIELETLRNGASLPDPCFLNARHRLYDSIPRSWYTVAAARWPQQPAVTTLQPACLGRSVAGDAIFAPLLSPPADLGRLRPSLGPSSQPPRADSVRLAAACKADMAVSSTRPRASWKPDRFELCQPSLSLRNPMPTSFSNSV